MAQRLSKVNVGIVGYGPAFGMGKHHADFINSNTGMNVVAVCDTDAGRLAAAQEELPGVATYESMSAMLKDDQINLVIIITPHNTHAKLAVEALNAGRNVIVEKPMCTSAAEARRMLEAASANDRMLSVFHNRRWDGDFLTIKQIIARGLLGEVFEVEAYMGNWTPPRNWWRDDKKVSGGAFFDWGAHILDWTLRLVDKPIIDVTGFFHKRVWFNKSNEDQVRAIIRFEDNVQADVTISSIARISRAKWRILGNRGTLEGQWSGDTIKVATEVDGLPVSMDVPILPAAREEYYKNISAHLRKGAELICKPEESALTICVMDAAERSAKSGKAQKVKL